MTELQELMRRNVVEAPYDDLDLGLVVAAGRRRVRARRRRVAQVAGSLSVVAVAAATLVGPQVSGHRSGAAARPEPAAPTLHLSDARAAAAGRDYQVLATRTNEDLDRDNGQYLDGVTDDGQILLRDGRPGLSGPRLALMDPTTGAKDWLPDSPVGGAQTLPVELGRHRLVLAGLGGDGGALVAYVFDRDTRQWSRMRWPGLPDTTYGRTLLGPGHRLYVLVPATQGQPPVGGWPTDSSGEADDAGAAGDTYALWSVSLDDPSDVRDEHLTVGEVAFTPTSMVWTDSTNGAAGLVHVRDLATGDEHSFDPHAGARCNLLSFAATDDRVVLGEYCGTYPGEVRDDRVQVVSTTGEQVATIQDSGIEGGISTIGGDNDLVTITSYEKKTAGTYLYDLGTGDFLRLSQGFSRYTLGGPAPEGEFLWATPVNDGSGAKQLLSRFPPAS